MKRRVMKHYVSLHVKEEDLEAAKNIKKIKGLEKRIHKELDDQRLTKMVSKRKDKLQQHYQ